MIETNIFGAALAFAAGAVIAVCSYLFSRYCLLKRPSMYAGMQIFRQIFQVVFLVALFFLGGYTPWDRLWLLLGGCFGITLPMIPLTYRLLKLNDSLQKKEDPSNG